jgi:hypothetical protein
MCLKRLQRKCFLPHPCSGNQTQQWQEQGGANIRRKNKFGRLRSKSLELRHLMAGYVQAYAADGILEIYGNHFIKKPTRMLMRNKGNRLNFEGLENRNVMAGDVTVAVVDGVLQIAGDAAENSIQIKQAGATWKIQGIGTTVNGTTTVKSFTGINHVKIDLGASNDLLKVTKGTLAGNFEFNDTAGIATVDLSKLKAKKIDITTHDGADTINMNGCYSIENLSIKTFGTTADGADTVLLAKTKTDMSMYVDTGNGDDVVTLKNVQGARQCKVDTFAIGESDDDQITISGARFEWVRFTTGDGNDKISVSKVTATDDGIHLDTGHYSGDTGDDVITVTKSNAHGSIEISTGDGADSVNVTNSKTNDELNVTTFQTSADGNDTIVLIKVQAGGSDIYTGAGADTVTQTKATIKYTQIIEVGAGIDQLLVQKSSAQEVTYDGGNNAGDKITLLRNKFAEKTVNDFDIEMG